MKISVMQNIQDVEKNFMNHKLLVVLLFSFGLLQASHFKSTGIPIRDKSAEIADYLQIIQEHKEDEERAQKNKKEFTKLVIQRKYIQKMIDYRDVLYASAQELKEFDFTTDQLVKIGDNLLDYAKQDITSRLAKVDINTYDELDEFSDSYDLTNDNIYSPFKKELSYINAIKSVREDLVFSRKEYHEKVGQCDGACYATCYCCGLCIIPVLVRYISCYKNPSHNEIQAKAVVLKSVVDIKFQKFQKVVQELRKERPDLMPSISLEESTAQIAMATITQVPQAVVYVMEIEREEKTGDSEKEVLDKELKKQNIDVFTKKSHQVALAKAMEIERDKEECKSVDFALDYSFKLEDISVN